MSFDFEGDAILDLDDVVAIDSFTDLTSHMFQDLLVCIPEARGRERAHIQVGRSGHLKYKRC